MTQYLVIAVIVFWAVIYSAWSLMPAGMRRAAAARVAAWAGRAGLGRERASTLQATLARGGGCSACASCKGCAKPGAENPERHPFL